MPGDPFALGLQFSVVGNPVIITALGVFDSTIGNGGTGFTSQFGPVNVGIYNADTSTLYAANTASFSGNAGNTAGAVSGYQFQTINALTLGVGNYIVVAAGVGVAGAADWNAFMATPTPTSSPIAFDNGGGAITFGGNLYANDGSSALEQPGTAGNMAAGFGVTVAGPSFQYVVVPEPSATELAFVGAGVLGAFRFGRRFIGLR